MRRMDGDEDLRNLFQKLKSRELQHVPAFDRVCEQRGRRHAERRPLRFALAAVVCVAVFCYLIFKQTPEQPDGTAISTWRSPTDALLKSPGSELLTSLPQIAMPESTFSSITIKKEDL